MTTARITAYIGGASVLVAWLASASSPPSQPPQPRPPQAAADEAALSEIAADVQSQAVRLRERLAVAPAPQAPVRNPFIFESRELARPKPMAMARVAAIDPEPAAAAVDADPLALIGMAEQQTPDGLVRTAMITGADDELLFVVEGQEVAGRYRAIAIGPDTVELQDLSSGATRRLALASPVERP